LARGKVPGLGRKRRLKRRSENEKSGKVDAEGGARKYPQAKRRKEKKNG